MTKNIITILISSIPSVIILFTFLYIKKYIIEIIIDGNIFEILQIIITILFGVFICLSLFILIEKQLQI